METVIKNINDKIEFGELKGQSFIEIFKFNYTYLEWLLRETEICFRDLDEFFKFGNPFDIQNMCLSIEAKKKLMLHVNENNRLSVYKGRRINYWNIKYLKETGLMNYKDLKEFNYSFPDEIVSINNKKINTLNKNQ
jgi:hypothetical protein